MADPDSLAGLTGLYYSLTYLGFVLPVLLAALAGSVGYPVLLVAVAVLCAGCAALVASGLHRSSPTTAAPLDMAIMVDALNVSESRVSLAFAMSVCSHQG